MRFISLFSGIGCLDLALERAGMTCVAQVEIDPQARCVLARHWPDVPRYEDVREFGRKVFDGSVDLIAGGFPCQDLSISGKRAGLAGERSGLWWQFRRIVRELKPRWVIVENVPGLLSSNAGRDFAVVIHGLVKCGYRVAWRVLDAQYFGVAQRRRRVFIVASLGNGRCAEVLFERQRLPGNPQARRKTWEEVASTLGAGSATGGRRSTDLDGAGAYIVGALTNRQPTSDASCANQGHIVFESRFVRNGRGAPDTIVPPLKAQSGKTGKGDSAPVIAFAHQFAGSANTNIVRAGEYAGALNVKRQDAVSGAFGVRRLTPLECERLQGLPDGWTDCQSDTARYRQIGNGVAVPVAEWIGGRIAMIDIQKGEQ